jgi:hypothetical protein
MARGLTGGKLTHGHLNPPLALSLNLQLDDHLNDGGHSAQVFDDRWSDGVGWPE